MQARIIPDPQRVLRAGDVAGAVDAFRQHWKNRITACELMRVLAQVLGQPGDQLGQSPEPLAWLEHG